MVRKLNHYLLFLDSPFGPESIDHSVSELSGIQNKVIVSGQGTLSIKVIVDAEPVLDVVEKGGNIANRLSAARGSACGAVVLTPGS